MNINNNVKYEDDAFMNGVEDQGQARLDFRYFPSFSVPVTKNLTNEATGLPVLAVV